MSVFGTQNEMLTIQQVLFFFAFWLRHQLTKPTHKIFQISLTNKYIFSTFNSQNEKQFKLTPETINFLKSSRALFFYNSNVLTNVSWRERLYNSVIVYV